MTDPSPLTWWARRPGDPAYALVTEAPTRAACVAAACAQLEPGERFDMVEARASDALEGEQHARMPFSAWRNREVYKVPEPAS